MDSHDVNDDYLNICQHDLKMELEKVLEFGSNDTEESDWEDYDLNGKNFSSLNGEFKNQQDFNKFSNTNEELKQLFDNGEFLINDG